MAEIPLHSTHSTLRERIVEHVFVGEALRTLWKRGITDVEVLRSEFDAFGYDLVMTRGHIQRHIQFKTGVGEKPVRVSVGDALAFKPGGCVIWIAVSLDLDLRHFWWFGGAAGRPLPDMSSLNRPKRIGRRQEGDRPERSNHRMVPAKMFRRIDSLDEVLEMLFGALPNLGSPAVDADLAAADAETSSTNV